MNKDNEYYSKIILKIAPAVFECMDISKQIFKGLAPQPMCEGLVLGFLLGKGFTYEESSVGLYQYHLTMEEMIKKDPSLSKTITGEVTIDNKGIFFKENS